MDFGLTGESHDDVGGDGYAGNTLANFMHQLAILLGGISASHVRQDRIIAGLVWNFDVWHYLGQGGNGFEQFIRHPVWVRGEKTQPFQAFDLAQSFEELGQTRVGGLILTIAVDDLPQQGDLFDALSHHGFCFSDDIFRRAALFDPAAIGDDAIGTGV